MADRADYRDRLQAKLVSLEDEGYGDFEFSQEEMNTYIELAVTRLYPHLYKRVKSALLTPTVYGNSGYGAVTVVNADRVFLVEDATERIAVTEWQVRPGEVININPNEYPTVYAYWTDAYELPADDSTDAAIPGVWTPVIVLGALIEALESRHDTGVRGDPAPVGRHEELPLVDRLRDRYEKAVEDLAMAQPVVTV